MKKKLYYGLGIGILLACQMGVNSYAGFWTDITDHALENVEHTDIVEQADGYVLLENTKKGFASSDTEYGIYDVVNQEWKIAYQGYEDADVENAEYVGDGIFAFQENGTDQDDMEQNVILLNAKSGEVTYAAIPKMSLDHLNFKNGYSISIGQTDIWDVFVIGEDGEYYPTGIRNRCLDPERAWDLDEYYTDGQYAVYTYDRSDFIIYDRDKDEISDFYNPVYAEKIVHTFSQDVDPEVYICDKYLVLTNMLGEDRQYYYTVLTFDGTEYIEPTMCDYATVTEWGNLLVENEDQIEEIKLTDKRLDVAQPVGQLVMTSFEKGSRDEEELAMDRKGQVYKNTVQYRYQLLKSGPYDFGDTWYLGGNYETFQGVWYCPYNTEKDVMVTVRLLGDEQVLYESPVINAQNCRQEFEVNVSGVQQLRLEYSGKAGTNDILFGLSDGEFLPAGVSGTVLEKKVETVEAAQDVMLYDLYAYQGGFSKTPEVTDNMGNEYYKAIRVSSYGESGTYDIGGKYTTLSGIIAVTKTSQDNDFDRNKRGYVRVYGDDTLLWEDADLTTETKPYEMSVDITGVTDLRVEIQGFGTHLMTEMMSVIFENATLKGNAAVNPAFADQPEEQTDAEPTADQTKDTGADKPVSQTTFPGLEAKSAAELAALPNQVFGGTWPTKSKIQGVECNTDTMNTVYFSYAKYLAAYSLSGELQDSREMEGYACDMDYYDGHLLITQRRKNSLFEILVFDADDLSQYRSIQLPDVNSLLSEDKMKCSSDKVKACIDGITIAPKFGTQDELKVYVSYGVWDDASETLACLRENQIILEYDLDDVLNAKVSELSAERRLQVNFGTIKFGIQSLEYDRDTGNVWCAVRKLGQYSLFCLDKASDGTELDLVWNGEDEGWDCDAAGDGICSLGNSTFYLLIPDYQEEQTSGTAKKARLR